jgi:hypothetical protein
MNIEISRDEFERLLGLLYIANWAVSGRKVEEDPRTAKYEEVVQKFYALAKHMGVENSIVAYDADLEKYVPTRTFEESSEPRKLLDEFADETFWHELTFRFTERDLARAVGGYEKMGLLNPEQRLDLETPLEEKYLEEFEEHGIERLEIVEHFTPTGVVPRTSD